MVLDESQINLHTYYYQHIIVDPIIIFLLVQFVNHLLIIIFDHEIVLTVDLHEHNIHFTIIFLLLFLVLTLLFINDHLNRLDEMSKPLFHINCIILYLFLFLFDLVLLEFQLIEQNVIRMAIL